MKLSPETRARERPQRYPLREEQPELPNLPPPLTENRAEDFHRPCNQCEAANCPCIGWTAFERSVTSI